MYIYASTFILSFILVYLLMKDLNIFNPTIYNNIDTNVWLNVYLIINIGMIHFVWLYSTFFLIDETCEIVYGLPIFLLVLYLVFGINLYLYQEKENDSIPILSQKIQKCIYILFTIYFILFLFFLIYPRNKFMIHKLYEIYIIFISIFYENYTTHTIR